MAAAVKGSGFLFSLSHSQFPNIARQRARGALGKGTQLRRSLPGILVTRLRVHRERCTAAAAVISYFAAAVAAASVVIVVQLLPATAAAAAAARILFFWFFLL